MHSGTRRNSQRAGSVSEVLIEGRQLKRYFGGRRRVIGPKRDVVRAVDDVSVALQSGARIGLVGESGSGKTTLGRMLAGLLPLTAGTILYRGNDLAKLERPDRRAFRRAVQYVFQDPAGSLNPRKRIRQIIEAPLRRLCQLRGTELNNRLEDLVDTVGLHATLLDRYPHELSGGQGQRVVLARALAPEPDVLVLDEPTSALDVSIQAQILELLADLHERLGLAYLFISHDLAVVERLCDQVIVLRNGHVVEAGPREEVFSTPRADYTRKLLNAVPVPGAGLRR